MLTKSLKSAKGKNQLRFDNVGSLIPNLSNSGEPVNLEFATN